MPEHTAYQSREGEDRTTGEHLRISVIVSVVSFLVRQLSVEPVANELNFKPMAV